MRRPAFALHAVCCAVLTAAIAWSPAFADGGVTFTDIAAGGGAGITYHRTASAQAHLRTDIINATPIPLNLFLAVTRPNSDQKGRGAPGVAIFDYDNDGDLDIYVTNGPGTPNSLYSNQLVETGSVSFVDVAAAAGVTATGQDSSGVCFGDIDNDGDEDLYVLGVGEPHHLFENNGDGTFTDITGSANAGGSNRHSAGCSFGDVNNDGLLDVVIANTYEGCGDPVNPLTGEHYPCSFDGEPDSPPQNGWEQRIPTFGGQDGPAYPLYEPNTLLVNTGGNHFVDDSDASGIAAASHLTGPGLTGGAFTWAIAMWDYDLDGNIDIEAADNQGGATVPAGLLRVYRNDGTGNFTETTAAVGLDTGAADEQGGWMGLSVADFNCDGRMDFFATNLGSYIGGPTFASRWFLQNPDGTFTGSVGDLQRTPFGWGTSTFDYDNDGDADIIFHGGNDITNLILADNPGVLLQNKGLCSGDFAWDAGAILEDHRLRTVQGVATGDLNNDGFDDIVSVSSFDIVPTPAFLPAFLLAGGPSSPPSPFDSVSRFQNVLTGRTLPGFVVPVNPLPDLPDGTLAVELNSAGNGNHWAKVKLLGSAGILPGGTVNRDGIGSSLSVTPAGGKTVTYQVLGGSSYASENSLTTGLGLGSAGSATVDVLWAGGVHNRLYGLAAGETVTLPHIPCSFDGSWSSFGAYTACVMQALNTYKDAGLITDAERNRLRDSAWQAYQDTH